jgi:HK97 family phage major capsid protein
MNEQEKLQTQLDAMKAEVITAAKAEAQTQITALKTELTAKISETEGLKSEVEKLKTDAAKNQPVIDKVVSQKNDIPLGPMYGKGFEEILEDGLTAKAANLTKYKAGEGKGFTIEMPRSRKTVGNLGSAANLTGSYFVQPDRVPGLTMALYEETHMRDLLPTGSTNSNMIRYIRDLGGEGGPTMVAEAGTKPQIDRDLQIFDAPVRKMATYFRVPEEMIEDIPFLSSFLTQIGLEEVKAVEDTQIIYGDGTGQNLSGLFTNKTAFAAGTSVIGASSNQFDVIRAARKQLRVAKVGGPLVGLISPVDWFDMKSKKDTTNNYLFLGGGNGIDLGMNIDGVQLVEHTAVTAGDFLVFSPKAAMIFDRSGTAVRFFDQDQDNAIKNLVTIVIEERLALAVYRTAGIIKGAFSTAITDLTS